MQNVSMKVVGSKLVIECDLEAEGTPSSTGKTTIIASTQGNQSVPGHAITPSVLATIEAMKTRCMEIYHQEEAKKR